MFLLSVRLVLLPEAHLMLSQHVAGVQQVLRTPDSCMSATCLPGVSVLWTRHISATVFVRPGSCCVAQWVGGPCLHLSSSQFDVERTNCESEDPPRTVAANRRRLPEETTYLISALRLL